MAQLDLSTDEILTTTRAVRKRLDFTRPVEESVIRECLELAVQAPSGSNAQGWHFLFVRDEAKRKALGEMYARAFDAYRDMPISAHALAESATDTDSKSQMNRVVSSAEYLAAHLAEVPVHFIPCISGRVGSPPAEIANFANAATYASIIPAAWSFMLAARSRGLGTAWTTLHLLFEKEAAELLEIPYDEVTQIALIPLAYTLGTDFKPAARRDLDEVLHFDRW